ncbi:MAG: 2OG-Fe dioxygenase family protein [Planctomycetes bacterium]|nr:2OG-Fe dioxygenase family protein [Planctomycetota bacterium]
MYNELLFEISDLPTAVKIADIHNFFQELPLDHYIKGNFRRRKLSRFIGPAAHLHHMPHKVFMQSDHYNHLYGNILRDYEELDSQLIACPAFIAMVQNHQDFFAYDPETTILGIHQIRISCSIKESGEPAPEGIHQDGFDYLSINCIARHQVSGAETQIYRDPSQEPIFADVLEPGQCAFVNDRNAYHFTSPIFPTGESGYRDVIVITTRCNADQDSNNPPEA